MHVVERVGGVPECGLGVGVDDELAGPSGPGLGHENRFGADASHSGPSRENDNVVIGGDALSMGDALGTDWVEFVSVTVGVTQHHDDPTRLGAHERRRRRTSKNRRVAVTVATSLTALVP